MPKTSQAWWRRFLPSTLTVGIRERLLASLGAFLGLLCTEWIAHQSLQGAGAWFVAPMGASAVLLFAAPTTPMAQPWPMLAGNLVSALVGVACARWLGVSGTTAAFAAGLAIAIMFQLRCLHPPGGAMAVTAVLGGTPINDLGFAFVYGPVLVNTLSLLVIALLFNDLLHRRYLRSPADQGNPHDTSDPLPSERLGFNPDDLDAVLQTRGEVLDISKEDLQEILIDAEKHAFQRRFGDVRCADIMSRDVVTVNCNQNAGQAWGKLARHKVKALPVVDDAHKLVGIISLHDFFIGHDNLPLPVPVAQERHSKTIAELMTENVASVRPEQPITDLVVLFSDRGLHHVPVINDAHEVQGMLTQSDLVAALFATSIQAGSRLSSAP